MPRICDDEYEENRNVNNENFYDHLLMKITQKIYTHVNRIHFIASCVKNFFCHNGRVLEKYRKYIRKILEGR